MVNYTRSHESNENSQTVRSPRDQKAIAAVSPFEEDAADDFLIKMDGRNRRANTLYMRDTKNA